MNFALVDRIEELSPPERIVTVKAVSLAEEYLADHFPSFPVLPGVLMLEALTEAGAWLVRAAQDFQHSMILLKEARNVTYKSFVKPGRMLRAQVTCRRMAQDESDFMGVGECEGTEVVKARFSLRHYNLAGRGREPGPVDAQLISAARAKLAMLQSF